MPNQKQDQEAKIDIKGTISKFVMADKPELTQEEEIMKFGEEKAKKDSFNAESDDDQNGQYTEEQEHLKRVKQELLASLDRVKKLAEKTFGKKDKDENKKNFKVVAEKERASNIKEKEEKETIETDKDRTRE